ncbi:reverse transcriptase domain-containing protein [Bernardetia sp. Wsw4-3y2]|uniref:reverse transcriptase domain-containing protein n=1 Tax=Bernardetia sp. Wsw4-3y2 TaxID=3127471 RepID=UPI0030D33896
MNKKKKIYPPKWLKYKPYPHLTNKIDFQNSRVFYALINYIEEKTEIDEESGEEVRIVNEKIAKHAFFPLIFRQLKDRKVRKKTNQEQIKERETGRNKVFYENKPRPIHYATHIDAHIYAYYGNILRENYDNYLESRPELSALITGYRKVKNENKTDKSDKRVFNNKNSVLFANEIFKEIKKREDCVVLALDIQKFFPSLDHQILKKAWLRFAPNIEEPEKLSSDHYNVFKSVVNFHYIKLDDLRVNNRGFDEKKLYEIRKEGGSSFFHSVEEFRNLIKKGKLRVYNNQFRSKHRKDKKNRTVKCGIPQGLPISATLSNIYMLGFDEWVFEHLVKTENIFYRRYSDDMIFICTKENYEQIKTNVEKQINEFYNLIISKEKTEVFFYKNETIIKQKNTDSDIAHKNSPLRYLGLEFDGKNIRIKSASISKYYRRMKRAIKAKERIVRRLREQGKEDAQIFKNQLYKTFYRESNIKKKGRKQKYGNYVRYIKKTSYQIYQKDDETVVTNQMKSSREIFKRELKNAEKRLGLEEE